jgi:hypothetical protein
MMSLALTVPTFGGAVSTSETKPMGNGWGLTCHPRLSPPRGPNSTFCRLELFAAGPAVLLQRSVGVGSFEKYPPRAGLANIAHDAERVAGQATLASGFLLLRVKVQCRDS